jgi:hypothetical protein
MSQVVSLMTGALQIGDEGAPADVSGVVER